MEKVAEMNNRKTDANPQGGNGNDAPPGKINDVITNVTEGVRSLRELLEARAEALESCRTALEERYSSLNTEWSEFGKRQTSLCEEFEQRESGIKRREQRCEEFKTKLELAGKTHQEQTQQVKQRDMDLQAQLEVVSIREKEITEQNKQQAEQLRALEQDQISVKKAQAQLEASKQKLDAGDQEIASKAAHLEQQRQEWESTRGELNAEQKKFQQEREQFKASQAELETHRRETATQMEKSKAQEAHLAEQASTIDRQKLELEQKQTQVMAMKQDWEIKLRDLNAARTSLSTLQTQLEGEITKVADQSSDLLPDLNKAAQSGATGPIPDAQAPSEEEKTARESMERFKKMCRDAKRRAIGV